MINNEKLKIVFNKTSGHCHFCGDLLSFKKYGLKDINKTIGFWAVDHVIQKGKGGANDISNYLPICIECNRLRWHRQGKDLRELIFLGQIALEQIKKKTTFGKHIASLKETRLNTNKKRRRNVC
jgi:5-methylcytosine-specific restriction endonuclease McrA